MKTVPIAQLQDRIILNLYGRITRDSARESAALNTLHKDLEKSVQKKFLKAAAEDLRDKKLVRQDARSRYHLTAAGIEYAQNQWGFRDERPIESEAWTGSLDRAELSTETRQRLVARLRDLQVVVEGLELPQSEREQIRAHIVAAVVLAEAPDPPWQIILTVLACIASVAAITSAVTDIVGLIGTGS